jgi:SAM-dependent methyltransferase
VLEGGCGWGQLVQALRYQGYKVLGIDFAEKTIRKIKEVIPELAVQVGDVRNLPIENNELDGYISVGVIEHFWEGYHHILAEMKRTLRKGGFLFVSFPYMSPLRKLKVKLRNYPLSDFQVLEEQKGTFYQFALNWKTVARDLQQLGFSLKEIRSYGGIKGFKDELTWFKSWLQPIFDGKKHQSLAPYLDLLFKLFASHCILLVMQKNTKNIYEREETSHLYSV